MMREPDENSECSSYVSKASTSSNIKGPPHIWAARPEGHSGTSHGGHSNISAKNQEQNDLSGPISTDDNISMDTGNRAPGGFVDQPLNDLSRSCKYRQSKRESLLERIEEQLREFQRYMLELENVNSNEKKMNSKPPLKPTFSTTARRQPSIATTVNNFPVGSHNNTYDYNHNEDIYVSQNGEGNLTVFCEPKDKPRSKVCYKQVGTNNTIINLTVSSNSFQVQDNNNGVISLGTDGEVWLEIKRKKKRNASENSNEDLYATVNKPQRTNKPGTHSNISREHGDQPNRASNTPPAGCGGRVMEDILSTASTDPYRTGRIAERERVPDEHSEYPSSCHDCSESVCYNPIYDQIKVSDDVLSVKLPSTSGLSLSNFQDLDSIPYMEEVLSQERVMNFLLNDGNEFDVQVCEWEYEKDPVYVNVPVRHPVSGEEYWYAIVDDQNPRVEDHTQCSGPPDEVDDQPTPALPPKPVVQLNEPPKRNYSNGPCEPPSSSNKPSMLLKLPEPAMGKSKSKTPSSPVPPPPPSPKPPATRRSPPKGDSRSPTSPVPPVPPRPTKFTAEESLRSYSWFHGDADKDAAVALLKDKPGGCFLVRKSINTGHDYALQFVDDHAGRAIKRLRILKTDGKFHIDERVTDNRGKVQTFGNLVDLIEAMMKTGLEIHEKHEWRTIQVVPFPK